MIYEITMYQLGFCNLTHILQQSKLLSIEKMFKDEDVFRTFLGKCLIFLVKDLFLEFEFVSPIVTIHFKYKYMWVCMCCVFVYAYAHLYVIQETVVQENLFLFKKQKASQALEVFWHTIKVHQMHKKMITLCYKGKRH